MAFIQGTTDPAQSLADAVSYGLDLDSTLNDFTVSFSTDAHFSNNRPNDYVVNLNTNWKDDMGLHLLQRSLLPPRNLRCVITLTGSLRITEDYGGAMKQSVKIPLADLALDEQNSTLGGMASSDDFFLQIRLSDPGETFTLEDNFDSFDRRKFSIGGPAIQEVKARGFQLAKRDTIGSESHTASFEPIVTKCRYLRITVADWKTISNPEVFSPGIISVIGNAGNNGGASSNIVQQPANDKKGSSSTERNANITRNHPVNTKRPCSCWKRDETGGLDKPEGRTDDGAVKHSDACESHWAALFGDYVQENKLKQARAGSGGMMASRWATGA